MPRGGVPTWAAPAAALCAAGIVRVYSWWMRGGAGAGSSSPPPSNPPPPPLPEGESLRHLVRDHFEGWESPVVFFHRVPAPLLPLAV